MVLLSLLLVLCTGQAEAAEARIDALQSTLDLLVRSEKGKALATRFQLKWGIQNTAEILPLLKWGVVSKTDSVLTRQFDPVTGREDRKRVITIYLKESSSAIDRAVDLAHEMTHATEGPSWDPYDPRLTPGKYIWESIDGRGGEVDALMSECQVAIELSSVIREAVPVMEQRCARYFSDAQSRRLDRNQVRADFYAVGRFQNSLKNKLGAESANLKLLSDRSPKLLSSTGGTPYPVALFDEFSAMSQVACENMKNRLDSFRSPASVPPQEEALIKSVREFIRFRCRNS